MSSLVVLVLPPGRRKVVRLVLADRLHIPIEVVLQKGWSMKWWPKRRFSQGLPHRSDPQDGQTTYFPNPKVVLSLKRLTLEEKYLLHAGYKFIIPDTDAIIKKPPSKCIAVYRVTFTYGVRFPLPPIIVEILNKYELALA